MSDTTPKSSLSVVDSAASELITSFIYEELISHVQFIQSQIVQSIKYLNTRTTKTKTLKSRLITIIDPYGNAIVHSYLDHQLLQTILKEFKKNYIPKYLHSWVKFGEMSQNKINALKPAQLNRTIAQVNVSQQFITYGEIPIWISENENFSEKLLLPVRLNDTIQMIQNQLGSRLNPTSVEMKGCILEDQSIPNEKHWNEATVLQFEDTILSKNLHQLNSIIMMKINKEKVNDRNDPSAIILFSLSSSRKPNSLFKSS